jgi:GntR family transcriptional regulator, arabinose operon transcriptional repressor
MSGVAKRLVTKEPHVPLHQRVLESLAREIESGKYAAGQRFPSEAALVRQFATSRITIGRALAELTRRGLVERVPGSGTFVRPQRAARTTFGLLIPGLAQTEIFEPMCRGMSAAAAACGAAVLLGDGVALEVCGQFIELGVAGVFFTPIEETPDADEVNGEIAARLKEARIAVVLLDRDYVRYPRRSGLDLVGIDNRRAGYLATEHLLTHGAKRVAFVGRARGAATVEARLAGYREAIAAARGTPLTLRPETIEAAEIVDAQRRMSVDGFVCANDRTAGEVMHALLAAGVRVPGDVRITGIDDVEYASLLPAPLTTVRQPGREIGEAAVAAMTERLAHPRMAAREILLECRLVVRASCGG